MTSFNPGDPARLVGPRAARAIVLAVIAAWSASVAASAQDQRPPIPVETLTVEFADTATVSEAFAGIAAARRTSSLGFETGGRVAEVAADVGDRVDEGAELARLDLRTLDAQIAAADATIAEARASLRLAAVTARRQRELVERGDASRQRLDEADANVDVSRARVAAAQAQADQLRVRRDLSIVTAPYDGVVTERYLDEGTVAGPGAPVLDITEIGAVEIRMGLPLARARALVPGREYSFRVDGRTARARLRARTDVVDSATQTVTAVFDVVAGDVAPGEVARVTLDSAVEEAGFWVPITALTQGRRGLWNVLALEPKADEAGTYTLAVRVVDVVHTEADRVFVRGAAVHGELIVAAGVERVVAGQRVAPVSATLADAR